jgi:hypothetical protein
MSCIQTPTGYELQTGTVAVDWSFVWWNSSTQIIHYNTPWRILMNSYKFSFTYSLLKFARIGE